MTRRDDPQDEQAFEDYLKRGSELSQRYRDSSADSVPPELDHKILMQAREAVSDKQVITHPSWWVKWNKPLALAATLMLAVTVIYKVGFKSIDKLAAPEVASTNSLRTEGNTMSVPTLAEAATTTQAKPAATLAPASVPLQPDVKEQDKQARLAKADAEPRFSLKPPVVPPPPPPLQVSVSAPATATPPAAAPSVTSNMPEKVGYAETKAKDATLANAGAVKSETHEAPRIVDSISAEDVGKFPDTPVAESLQRVPGVEIKREDLSRSREKKLDATDAERALNHIRELRKQGKKKQADKAWEQFKKDFPDYLVAEDDPAR